MSIFYISSLKSKKIFVWKIDESDLSLKLIQKVDTPGYCQPIAIHPNKKNLYVGVSPNFGIIHYQIDDFGILYKISSTKFPNKLTYISIDTNGNFLFGSSFQGNCLYISKIENNGIINPPNKILENLQGCHFVHINKIKETLWVTCLKEDKIRIYSIHELYQKKEFSIYLKHTIKSSIGSGPRHIAFYKSFAYVSNELNGTISVIKTVNNSSYVIQTINIIPFNYYNIPYWTSDIHVNKKTKQLYCCDRNHHIISCFKIIKNGFLSFSYFENTETQPREFDIDPQQKYLIIAGQKSNHISMYKINSNIGNLINCGSYNSGIEPIWVSFL